MYVVYAISPFYPISPSYPNLTKHGHTDCMTPLRTQWLSGRPFVRGQLVKMLITLEPRGIFRLHFAYICMSTFHKHWHAKPTFLLDEGLLSISLPCCCQLVKMIITLEPYGIFGSNFAYLFILILSGDWYAKG